MIKKVQVGDTVAMDDEADLILRELEASYDERPLTAEQRAMQLSTLQ